MALDFTLNLILPHQNTGIFCRSNVEATCYLIKQYLPHVTSRLKQILASDPLPLDEELNDNIYQQSFYVDLPHEQVCEIVDLLAKLATEEPDNPTPGLTVLARSLYREWSELASSLDTVDK